MRFSAVAAATAALFAASAVADVDPIVIKGSKFFYQSNGTQFYIRGVAYQQGISSNGTTTADQKYIDPLGDSNACKRDIPLLSELRTNTIRVYALDPTVNHDDCMKQLADAGIYVIADLSQPGQSINRDTPTWDDDLYARYTSVVDVMQKYKNTLGFFAGNEVSNAPNNTAASAFVKAAVRDMKLYIKQRNYRTIGVGYATNDDADIRQDLAKYFNCGQDQSAAIDFWGYNIYSWCGDSSFQKSGYDVRTKEFSSYSVPVFFAEYGCNQVKPRKFTDIESLYGSDMSDIWSGGIVYMYFQEDNQFGLVQVDGNNAKKLDDFDNLSSEIQKATPTGVNMNDYKPTNTVPADCPALGPSWAATASPLPPAANPELCGCMMNSLSCVVGQNVDKKDYGTLFGTVCGLGQDVCKGIAHNATTGVYGAYSMCNAGEQLSFVMNQYASSQNGNAQACDFNGAGSKKSASQPSGNCDSLLKQAGTNGAGTVTSVPTGAGRPSGSKGAAAGPVSVPTLNLGLLPLGAYLVAAFGAGAGMILL